MTEAGRGILALAAACTVRGLSPVYHWLLFHVPAIEVAACRVIWSLVFFAALLAVLGRIGALWQALPGRWGVIGLAGGAASALSGQTHAPPALSGPPPALPLILFSHAARRMRLSMAGLMRYINPTLQFVCAVWYFAKPSGVWHGIAVPLIWLALAIHSVAGLRRARAVAGLR